MVEWIPLEETTLFESRFVRILKKNFRVASGKTTGDYIIAEKKDFAVMVLFCDGKILFLRQYRPGIRKTILNLPMGFIEQHETPVEAASRELREETGYSPEELTPLGKFAMAPGFCTFYAHMFFCRVDDKCEPTRLRTGSNADSVEGDNELVWMSPEQISQAIKGSTVCDASSTLALLLSQKYLI